MKKLTALILTFALFAVILPMTAMADQYGPVSGSWESVTIEWEDNTSDLQAFVLDAPLVNCSQMTVNMKVSMKNGAKCRFWRVLGRMNGRFEEIGQISLPSGNGSTVQTLSFQAPITIDAVTIRPTVSGNYSWTNNFTLTDVMCAAPKAETTAGLARIEVGDILVFGSYEQDNDLSNGPEPIEWIVLETKPDGKSMVLLSRYCLDCVPFHTAQAETKWEDSSVRRWLNKAFLNTAFSSEERQYLAQFYVQAEDNPVYGTSGGSVTVDRVTLLSISDANDFFVHDEDRRCDATPYAEAQGTQVYSTGAWWRLRSPGKYDYSAASVFASGAVSYEGDAVADDGCGIRPVILFSLPE